MNYQEITWSAKWVCVRWQERKRNKNWSRACIWRKLKKSLQDNMSLRKWSLTRCTWWAGRQEFRILLHLFASKRISQEGCSVFGDCKSGSEHNPSHWFGQGATVTWVLLESWWGWCAQTEGGKSGEVQLPVADVLSVADIWQDFPAMLGFSSRRACGACVGGPGS